jgi:hypothetical protein
MTTQSTVRLDGDAVLSAPIAGRDKTLAPPFDIKLFYQSATGLLDRALADPSLRAAGFVFLLTRALVFLVFILTTHIIFNEPPSDFGSKAHELSIRVRRTSVPEHLRELAMRSDGSWYISVARDGYEKKPFDLEKEHNWAFFPLYPLTIRAVASVTGQYRLMAIALSNLFFFLALILLAPVWLRPRITAAPSCFPRC